MSLLSYVESINIWRRMSDQPVYPNRAELLVDEEAKELFNRIECDLSPENLSCDGELSYTQIQARLSRLRNAVRDLTLGGHSIPSNCSEIQSRFG